LTEFDGYVYYIYVYMYI